MRRRFGADVLLAIVLPVVAVLALLLLHPDRDEPHGRAPVETPLTTASVVCPGALPGTGSDLLGVSILGADPDAKVTGDVQVGLGASATPLRVRTRRVVHGTAGDSARRWSPAPATSRPAWSPGARRRRRWPRSTARHRWPTSGSPGSAPDATHDSVRRAGQPERRPGHRRHHGPLTQRGPRRARPARRLGARQHQHRGSTSARSCRTAASSSLEVQHQPRPARGARRRLLRRARVPARPVQDWLPPQAEPATTNLLLGLARGAGERTLVLANPGADEVRATITVVTPTLGVRARPASSRSGWRRTPPRRSRSTTCSPRRPRTAPSGCSSSRPAR